MGSTPEPLEPRRLLHGGVSDFHIQFGPSTVTPVDGYVVDAGATFDERGHDLSFGWLTRRTAVPKARRDNPLSPDARYDTFAQTKRGATWELAVPDGEYAVRLVAGDAKARRGSYGLDVEGTEALRGTTTPEQRWVEATVNVTVADGRLTIQASPEFRRNVINFVDVSPVEPPAGNTPPSPPAPDPEQPPETPPTTPPSPTAPSVELGPWRAGARSPIERAESVGAAVDGKLYVFGGIDGRGSNYRYPVTNRVHAYDPATDSWQRLANMPEPFTHSVATVDGGTIWFPGSFVGDTPGPGTTHVWKYDTLTDTWSRGPDLPEPRGGGASAIVGRTLHYFGGANETRTADMPTHWSLDLDDPAAAWVRRADMPMPRNHMAAATVDGKIFAVGGQRGEADAAVDLAEVDVYDPATDTWSSVAPMPGARSHTNSSTLEFKGKLLVIGGESGDEQYEEEILLYDPPTNAWSTIANLPNPRSTAVAGIINGELVLATGNAPGISDDTWIAAVTASA